MSAICPLVRDGFGDYLADRLPAPQRRILREHLAVCAECRQAAAARDASLLLARPFEPEEVSPATTESILASVRAGVAHIETERRIGAERPGRSRAAVAAAAAVLALLAVTVPSGRREERIAAVTPAPPKVAPTRVADAAPAAGLADAALPEESAAPSTATVYELNPGAGREEPRVVWIVDRGLDI